MSSDLPNASPSPTPDEVVVNRELVERVRLLGAPLLEALESHSPGSGEHADATGWYAFAGAAGIGLDRGTADLCRETAKLHDIGMIYVPAAVTGKPFDSWSAQEREVFDAHYDEFRGAITYVRIMNGTVRKGQKIKFLQQGTTHEVIELGHFTPQRHFAFEAVAWYWHFVDVVWLGLFIFVYWI